MELEGIGGGGIPQEEESRMCHQDLLSPPGMRLEREERPQQAVRYRAGDEIRGVDLGERRKNENLKIAYYFSGLSASVMV